jgi:transposase
MKHQLGIDISKLTFDACLCVNGKPKRRQFSNNQAGFEELLKWFGKYPPGSVHVCMEGTGRLWEPLAEFLYAREIPVSVVNPLRIKGFAKCELRRSKTDKLDAETIARFCGMHNPRLWVAPSARLKSIRDIQRAVGALTSMQADEKNRLTSGELDPLVKATFEDHIAYLDSKIKMLEDEILVLLKADEELFRKRYQCWSSFRAPKRWRFLLE